MQDSMQLHNLMDRSRPSTQQSNARDSAAQRRGLTTENREARLSALNLKVS